MTKSREEYVEEFHKTFNVGINEKPSPTNLRFRKTLLEEEVKELIEEIDSITKHLENGERVTNDMYENMLKELADVQVVLSGMAVQLKPLRKLGEAFLLVHKSNMSKLGENGKPIYRKDGKVLKGPNYHKPDLKNLIE